MVHNEVSQMMYHRLFRPLSIQPTAPLIYGALGYIMIQLKVSVEKKTETKQLF